MKSILSRYPATLLIMVLITNQVAARCVDLPRADMMSRSLKEISFVLTDTIPAKSSGADMPATAASDKPLLQPAESANEIVGKKPGIKLVPRSRRQARPRIVSPKVEVTPLPVIRPKIIKPAIRL